jgi:hypothetical protein
MGWPFDIDDAMGRAVLRLVSASLLASCAAPEYADGGSSDQGGASGTQVSSATTASSMVASTTSGSEPCTPNPEQCNGVDDDCDGIADEPDTADIEACGCYWTTLGARRYARCANDGPAPRTCPEGMRLAVLSSLSEKAFAESLLLSGPSDRMHIGLRQDETSFDPYVGWAWEGAVGIPAQWDEDAVAPNDELDLSGEAEPLPIENHTEDCGALTKDANGDFDDVPCDAPTDSVLCEEATEEPCVNGEACLRSLGCVGLFDCSLPAGERCVAAPATEVCDGLDNDCDGEVDDWPSVQQDACGCAIMAFSSLKKCEAKTLVPHCGPGYRPMQLEDASDIVLLKVAFGSLPYRAGGYQAPGVEGASQSWQWFDGSPAELFWASGQPQEATPASDQCLGVSSVGWVDEDCSNPAPFLCEPTP